MYISFGLLTVLALVIIFIATPFKNSTNITSATKQYRSSKHGFSINYPSNWEVLNEKGLAKLQNNFVFALVKRTPGAIFGVKIQKAEAKGVKLEEVAQALDKDLPKNFNKFSKIGQEVIALKNQKALKYSYTFSSKSGIKTWQQLVIIPTPEKVFHLTAWTGFQETAEQKEIGKIINSFKVL